MSVFKTENGVEYVDDGDDGLLEEVIKLIKESNAKKMEQSDSLRDKRMAGLPVKRKRNK